MSAAASATTRRLTAGPLADGAFVSVVTLPASAADHTRPSGQGRRYRQLQYASVN
ncbi:hypothetical protein [Streptomyces massasporeus]|uniref:hypothetical protein n=1 Tax=Streptomyces massasporeus TaxID=67324 RepID=UPI00381EE8DB